jgi:hypothetical protein
MVALVVAGVIGIALTRLLINQSRFVAAQDGYMRARAGARAGFNVIVSELRMITYEGLLAASSESVKVRVPVAWGLACTQPSGGYQAIGLLPYDSASYAAATIAGWAWRGTSTAWNFEAGGAVSSGNSNDCNFPGNDSDITVLTNGTIVRVTPNNASTPYGAAAYLYQEVTYRIAPSSEIPGRTALWRSVTGGESEELVAPFNSASSFSFLVGRSLSAQAAVPSNLDSVMGLRVRLIGQSEETPEGRSSVTEFDLSTDIVFMNRVQ